MKTRMVVSSGADSELEEEGLNEDEEEEKCTACRKNRELCYCSKVCESLGSISTKMTNLCDRRGRVHLARPAGPAR